MSIRPTSDKSREALFSILGDQVQDSRILDLFAGTGALGIEGLSRGGHSAIFVDNNPVALKLIKANINLVNNCISQETNEPVAQVIRNDLVKCCQSLFKNLENQKQIFDIIFLDPPYDKGISFQILKQIDKSNLLDKNGLIIAEERSNVVLPSEFDKIKIFDRRKYGDTGFWFYKTTAHRNAPRKCNHL